MDSCHVLYEYAVFVAKIKKYRDSMELKEAIDLTVRECIEENILRDFLEQHRREVCDMCLTEFDEKKYEDVLREEGREEGLAEGRSEERKTLLEIVQKLKEGKTPEQLVADGMEKESVDSFSIPCLQLTVPEFFLLSVSERSRARFSFLLNDLPQVLPPGLPLGEHLHISFHQIQ